MSRPPDDPGPPRRPGPRPAPGDEPTTWRPAPAGLGADPARPGAAAAAKADREPKVVSTAGPGWVERVVFGSVGAGHLANFCRQLAAYLDAGVDILKALGNLERQYARTALGPPIGRVRAAIKGGSALGEAMAREPKAFDPLFLNMIRVAEARGGVPETLRGLSQHYLDRQSLIRQARSAMIYPLAVLLIAGVVMLLLTTFILPMFADLLKDIAGRGGGGSLPLPSRVLMGLSWFMQAMGWWVVPLAVVGSAFAALRLYATPAGKASMDSAALWVPVLGPLLRKIDTCRFARTLGVLLQSGVGVGESLDLTASVLTLTPFRRAIHAVKVDVMNGTELGEALGETGRFGADVVAVVEAGEESGKLPESLDKLADDYQEQVTYMVKNLGQLVQPIILVGLGGVVLFIILAVFLPYISVLTSLGAG